MNAKRKIEIGMVYSAKVAGTWLPVRIEKSLGHGRYEGADLTSGKSIRTCTDAIKGDGQTVEHWTAARTRKADDVAKAVEAVEKGNLAEGITVPAAKKRQAKTPKAEKVRQPKGPRHSLANAAILVLAKAKEPMNAKAIVERATEDGLYAPGDGKTPEATLYSAMLRDKKARFLKAERGVWTLTDAGKAEVDAIRQAFAVK